ncbi:MAG: MFS transporter [Armatimonadaceae bacterium]
MTPATPADSASTSSASTDELHPNVRALGVVSLCTDLSSEMVYPINPIFLRSIGAPPFAIGLIEGCAESVASLLKLYSGYLSDRIGQRKPLTLWGYGVAALSKPLLGVAGVWWHVLLARLLDRTGKGLRSAPRDALITETTPESQRGRAFGFHRAMDTTGAVLGPLIGYCFLRFFPGHLRWLYFLAFLPALVGVLVLLFLVREVKKDDPSTRIAPPKFTLRGLSPEYRYYLGVLAVFGIGNSSDAFLLLRAEERGLGPELLLLLYALFNVVEACLAAYAGRLSDRFGRRPLIAAGYGVFALVYLGFALLQAPQTVWFLFPLYGFYYTLTGGTQRALAADLAHPERRGMEIGAFHLLVGIAALPASLLAGFLYQHLSPAAPFYLGATTALIAAVLLLLGPRTLSRRN